MAAKNPKLLEDKRNTLKKLWNNFSSHKEAINAAATIILVIVSIVLIFVTVYSAIVANNLGKIEIYLAIQKEKQETMEQINLAENLLLETLQNQDYAEKLVSSLEWQKNRTEVTLDMLKITRLQQAKDMITFGSQDIRSQLDNYLDIITAIKDDIEEVRKATRNQDTKIRNERISSALRNTDVLLNQKSGLFKMEGFIEDIRDYITERTDHYQNIDKDLEKEI